MKVFPAGISTLVEAQTTDPHLGQWEGIYAGRLVVSPLSFRAFLLDPYIQEGWDVFPHRET